MLKLFFPQSLAIVAVRGAENDKYKRKRKSELDGVKNIYETAHFINKN